MNPHLQTILDLVKENNSLTAEEKTALVNAVKKADNDLTISEFKLERTEKVKRTTAILLEETIEELQQKRKAIEETNAALQESLENLKATQSQLIQSEKMASLGELTAGIAHEIQNPLNFVNNFSEVSNELIKEIQDIRSKTKDTGQKTHEEAALTEEDALLQDIASNLEKILHHGKRADGIVKGMLQHSKSSSGTKEPTDINALCDEYLRLAYHGLRAKDKTFNSKFETDFDPSLPKINVVPQDIGRVVLNLINNAFYAVHQQRTSISPSGGLPAGQAGGWGEAQPLVTVTTKLSPSGGDVIISVRDNGPGIPDSIKEKIFQPFFTTKPTGEGTGLGLSLSYDIVKAHGGELKVETKRNEGTTFSIRIPLT